MKMPQKYIEESLKISDALAAIPICFDSREEEEWARTSYSELLIRRDRLWQDYQNERCNNEGLDFDRI